ncbi:MAG TPA: 2-dehydropantoate 2-reductase [Candidatus Nitrosotalea sp.]|nr:2-dehydropantoate 2-reductase [Candidatus Nitrosotalea sp.]
MRRIAVVGAGAIGGFLAAALARSGLSVAVVARGEQLEAIRRDGLHVESDLGSFSARVDAAADLRELGDFDALLLTFKAHQWPELLSQLEPFAHGSASIVTLQNGVPFWYVREPPLRSVDPGGNIGRLFPDERIVGGVVHVSGHLAEPGLIRQSGGLRYVLGDPRGGSSARVEMLAQCFRDAGLAPEIDVNIRATVWLKLVNNSGLNPVSVLRRTTIVPMLADPEARAEVRELMTEAMHVGQAIGAIDSVDVDQRIAYAARLNDVKTSMLQDYELGRPLELEPILGAVIELGLRHGVEVGLLQRVYGELAH